MKTEPDNGGLLQEKARKVLHQAVCEGELPPGSEHTESELAARFQLTKGPLRAALLRLSHEGWLTASARRGYQVRHITLRDTQDIFALRKLLEPPAVRMAAGRIIADVLRRLDDNCHEMYEGDDEEAQRRFYRANKAFHVGIAQATGNLRLALSIGSLHDECERILRFGMKYLDWSQDWRNGHEEIVEALTQGKGEEAEQIALRQLETSEKIVLDALMLGFSNTPLMPQRG